jgi:HSP20 family protein
MFEDMDKLTREMWDTWSPFTYGSRLVPHTDMYEEKDTLVMKTELPGINKEEVDITLEGDRLTIRAEKKEEVTEDATHHTNERYYGQYFRSVTLPFPVKEKGVSATFENGVLELRLPKAEEVKAKKIEIKAELPKGETKKRQTKAK